MGKGGDKTEIVDNGLLDGKITIQANGLKDKDVESVSTKGNLSDVSCVFCM